MQVLHHYYTFLVITNILHLDYISNTNKYVYKKIVNRLIENNIFFKVRPNKKSPYQIYLDESYPNSEKLKTYNLIHSILNIKNETLINYIKSFNIPSTLFKTTISTNKINNNPIDFKQIITKFQSFKIFTNTIIQNQLNIHPTLFNNFFNSNLSKYRENLKKSYCLCRTQTQQKNIKSKFKFKSHNPHVHKYQKKEKWTRD